MQNSEHAKPWLKAPFIIKVPSGGPDALLKGDAHSAGGKVFFLCSIQMMIFVKHRQSATYPQVYKSIQACEQFQKQPQSFPYVLFSKS